MITQPRSHNNYQPNAGKSKRIEQTKYYHWESQNLYADILDHLSKFLKFPQCLRLYFCIFCFLFVILTFAEKVKIKKNRK